MGNFFGRSSKTDVGKDGPTPEENEPVPEEEAPEKELKPEENEHVPQEGALESELKPEENEHAPQEGAPENEPNQEESNLQEGAPSLKEKPSLSLLPEDVTSFQEDDVTIRQESTPWIQEEVAVPPDDVLTLAGEEGIPRPEGEEDIRQPEREDLPNLEGEEDVPHLRPEEEHVSAPEQTDSQSQTGESEYNRVRWDNIRSSAGPDKIIESSRISDEYSSGFSHNHLTPAKRASFRKKGSISRKSFYHNEKRRSSESSGSALSYIRGKLLCCKGGDSEASDNSSDNAALNAAIKEGREDEIIYRLQRAVNELAHRPTPYEIETEVMRWQRTLEVEQHEYEEKGKPKFKYNWFRRNKYLIKRKHPLYATNYENQRSLETRLEEFRFGASESTKVAKTMLKEMKIKHSYIAHAHLNYYEEAINWGSGYWSNDKHVFMANLALITSASNLLRFPQICYVNGGFTFLVTYWLLLALVGQPLLYFEMLLGQFSLNGPLGFGSLHPWAVGIPYAIGFVCVVFGTCRNVFLLYSSLYFIVGFFWNPGKCYEAWVVNNPCFPYNRLEEDEAIIRAERASANFTNGYPQNISVFSIDLYFREVMLDIDWREKMHDSPVHWKLIVAAFVEIGIIFLILRNSLTGRRMKKYLRYTIIIPIMLTMVFIHQAFFRGAFGTSVFYFVVIDIEHVYVSNIWGKAFEMVLSTLGIGYGYHWSISGKVRFDYRNSYRTSWKICGFAALYGLISSLVLYCEVGIVGQIITGDPNQYHVFLERLGASFVCYSGALIKFGFDTPVMLVIFFMLFTALGMWSQIIIIDLLFRWIDQGYIVKGVAQHQMKRKSTTVVVVIIIQLLIVSPHFFKVQSSNPRTIKTSAPILATEDVFEGYFAAYVVLMAELFTIVYLYGFARFLVDVEIMTKIPLPALFQIQIRYIVMPTILLFMSLMILDAYLEPTLYTDQKDIGILFYVGVLLNFAPILIMVIGAQYKWMLQYKVPTNKVKPEPYKYSKSTDIHARSALTEQRFVAKKNAPSQSRSETIRSEIFDMVNEHMDVIYESQIEVKDKVSELLEFKKHQNKWLLALLKVLSKIKIKSFTGLVRILLLRMKFKYNKVDIRFLSNAMDQFVYLAFYASQRKIYNLPERELYVSLADELIKVTNFHDEDFEEDSVLSSLSDHETDSSYSSSSSSSSSLPLRNKRLTWTEGSWEIEELNEKYIHLHRKLLGKLDKSPEEDRTTMEIRIKKALNLPYKNELDALSFLRRARARYERELALWNVDTSIPIDHFVPASISHHGEKVAFTIFHAVVVQGNDHFVLKKLPMPRPPIMRVTAEFVKAQPGKTMVDKFAHITTRKMLRYAKEIMNERNLKTWTNQEIHKNLRKVTDMLDEDVYHFLDPLLTCIIVIVPEHEADQSKKQLKYYLTPPTRRHPGAKYLRKLAVQQRSRSEFGITTFQAMTQKQIQDARWNDLLSQPPDIVFHPYSSDSDDEIGSYWHPDDVWSSSSSKSSDLDGVEPDLDHSSRHKILTVFDHHVGESRFILENETLQTRDNKGLLVRSESDLHVDIAKMKHISGRKWTRIHTAPELEYTKAEKRLHRAIDTEAKRRGDIPVRRVSKSDEILDRIGSDFDLKRTLSLESIQQILGNEIQMDVQKEEKPRTIPEEDLKRIQMEGRLSNLNPNLLYTPVGKIMVVDRGLIPLIAIGGIHSTLPTTSNQNKELEIEVNV